MAHRRGPLVTALALNTAALAVEVGAGIPAKSLSLVMDGVHNVSDEVALGFLVLAYSMRVGARVVDLLDRWFGRWLAT
jgi:Co/Zn/Cd efflux system component